MTQSLSFIVADRPPAMYRIEAVAIVVSRISMNVGITTAVATSQGLTAGRLTAAGASVTLLMTRPPRWTNVLMARVRMLTSITCRRPPKEAPGSSATSLWYPVSERRRWAINWLMIANNTAVDSPKNRRPLMASRGPSNRHRSDSRTSPYPRAV